MSLIGLVVCNVASNVRECVRVPLSLSLSLSLSVCVCRQSGNATTEHNNEEILLPADWRPTLFFFLVLLLLLLRGCTQTNQVTKLAGATPDLVFADRSVR